MEEYRDETGLTVQPEGELSFINAQSTKAEILGKLIDTDKKLTISLAAIEFLDSTGLGALISIAKEMKSRGGELVLEYPKIGVGQLLKMSHMDMISTIIYTADDDTESWARFDENGYRLDN